MFPQESCPSQRDAPKCSFSSFWLQSAPYMSLHREWRWRAASCIGARLVDLSRSWCLLDFGYMPPLKKGLRAPTAPFRLHGDQVGDAEKILLKVTRPATPAQQDRTQRSARAQAWSSARCHWAAPRAPGTDRPQGGCILALRGIRLGAKRIPKLFAHSWPSQTMPESQAILDISSSPAPELH